MGLVVELTSASEIKDVIPELVGGVIPATADLDHAYVGAGAVELLVILYTPARLLHQLAVGGLVITAVGFTVIEIFLEGPSHPLTFGVTT